MTGGPGVSGVDNLIKGGRAFQALLSAPENPKQIAMNDTSSSAKYFDAIGFDARGINNTTPRLSCFGSEQQRREWALQAMAEGIYDSSERAFDALWARNHALWGSCTDPKLVDWDAEDKVIGRFINTAPVARDVIAIVDAHAQWREKEAERLFGKALDLASIQMRDGVRELVRFRPGEEKLQYWGFSYGTILGATLAASYPERIGRAVLDGVADAEDFFDGGWKKNLLDTDKGLDWFSRDCFDAGPDKCALYVEGGPDAVKARFRKILTDLKANPLPVVNTTTGVPEVVTWSDIKRPIMNAQYWGLKLAGGLAQQLRDIEEGNGTTLADAKSSPGILRLFLNEPTGAVLCADGPDLTGMTKEEYLEYWNTLTGQSELMGELWGEIKLRCTAWHFRPKWRYTG